MDATSGGWLLLITGTVLLAGYVAHVVGQRAHVPRVTLLLLLGVLIGPDVLALVPTALEAWFPTIAQMALSMVGFLLGERFLAKQLRKSGRLVTTIAVGETICAAAAVVLVSWLLGTPIAVALLLAGIAAASDPAATVEVVHDSRSRGPVTDTLLGVVAIDDALGIVLFSLLLVLAQALTGQHAALAALMSGAWEIAGAVGLGVVLGIPMAWATGRVRRGELTLIEATGFVLTTGGLASLLGVSYLLACMTLGIVVANRARHHTRPFHEIEGISHPFLIIFFVLVGFEFDLDALGEIGIIGLGYVVARGIGKIVGASIGARAAAAPPQVRRHVGWCLQPQAGVALGLGLLAAERFPAHGTDILSLLLGTTFVLEVIGPIATRIALARAGESAGMRPKARRSGGPASPPRGKIEVGGQTDRHVDR